MGYIVVNRDCELAGRYGYNFVASYLPSEQSHLRFSVGAVWFST